jgi:hypothetical protein
MRQRALRGPGKSQSFLTIRAIRAESHFRRVNFLTDQGGERADKVLNKRKMGLLAVAFVLVVVALETFALQLGSLELDLPNAPAVAENP